MSITSKERLALAALKAGALLAHYGLYPYKFRTYLDGHWSGENHDTAIDALADVAERAKLQVETVRVSDATKVSFNKWGVIDLLTRAGAVCTFGSTEATGFTLNGRQIAVYQDSVVVVVPLVDLGFLFDALVATQK